jgi:hypothetical protein
LHESSGNPPLAFERLSKFEAHLFSDCPLIVLRSLEGPIKPRRRDFKGIGVGERIGHIERRP